MKQELILKERLPEGWKWVPLLDVANAEKGTEPGSASYSNSEGTRFLRIGEVSGKSDGAIFTNSDKINLVDEKDILMTFDGSPGLVCRGLNGAISSGIRKIYSKDEKILDNNYLFWILQSPIVKKVVEKYTNGAILKHAGSSINHIKILLPPLPVQQQIVSKLDAQMAHIEIMKKEAEKEEGASEEMITSQIEEIFSSTKEFKLPMGWKLVKLKDITSKLGDGLHGTPGYSQDGDYFFINGNNLDDGKILIKLDTKKVSKEEYEKYKKELNDRTIFISINGTLGNVAFYNNENVVLSKSVCYFNVIENIDKDFLKIIFNSKYFLDYCNDSATGSTIKNVSLESMRNFIVPLPDFLTQKKIVTAFNLKKSNIKEIQQNISQKLSAISQLPSSLLNEVFGKYGIPEVK